MSSIKDRRREHCHQVPVTVVQSVLGKGLTREQRVSLFGPGPGEADIQVTLMDATTGVAVLACQHIAQRLTQDPDAKRLSRRDLLALRMAPQIASEVKKTVPAEPPPQAGPHDPIVALLGGGRRQETVRAENKG